MKPLTCALLFVTHVAAFWLGSALAEHDSETLYESRRQSQLLRLSQVAALFDTNATLHARAAAGTNNAAEHAVASQVLGFARTVVLQTIEEVRQLP